MKTRPARNRLRWSLLLIGLFVGNFPTVPCVAQWKYDITLTGYPQARWKSLTSYIDKPAIADVTGDGLPEIIATSVFGDVYCVDGTTGQIIWMYEDEHSLDLAIYICPATIDVNCDGIPDIISVTPQGNIICLNGRTGRKMWGFKAEASVIQSPSAFDLDRNGTPEIAAVDIGGNLYVLNQKGNLIWKTTSDVPFAGAPAMGVIDGQPAVILTDRGGMVRAYDGLRGRELWRFAPGARPFSTSALVFKDERDSSASWKVLAGTDGGEIYLVNAITGAQVWRRVISPKGAIGDFALGDLDGDGILDFVFSTSRSRIISARITDGRENWRRKFDAPVKELRSLRTRRRLDRDVLTGEPVLADIDGDGRLDLVVDFRGLNNFINGIRGADGKVIWAYGNSNLMKNPALRESATVDCCADTASAGTFTTTVPTFSQPTPVVADFDGDGKADLIVNDRDEVGLINVPLPAPPAARAWAKYLANQCNNNVNFAASCLGVPAAPTLTLEVEPGVVFRGDPARLCWKNSAEATVHIDQGIGEVVDGSCVDVNPSENTTWHGLTRNCGGEARAETSLIVKPRQPAQTLPAAAIDREPCSLEDVFFEYDWYRLTPEARKTLSDNAAKLRAHPAARVALEATCDERGSMIYNKYLAIARADSVREYMVSAGIAGERMEARPQGESLKWDANRTDEGWAKNRRVHFVILP